MPVFGMWENVYSMEGQLTNSAAIFETMASTTNLPFISQLLCVMHCVGYTHFLILSSQ